MGILEMFTGKKIDLSRDEIDYLKDIEKKAYLERMAVLMQEKGLARAEKEGNYK